MRESMRRRRFTYLGALALSVIAAFAIAQPAAAAPRQSPPQDLWTVPTRPASDFTILVAYSFGNRIPAGVDPTRTVGQPGPVNEALADAIVATRGTRTVPIYAQTEIASVLRGKYGLTDVIEIGPDQAPDGTLVYLSTDGVAKKVASLRGPRAGDDVVGVIAFSDHQWRSVYTTVAAGFHAYGPGGMAMPATYDPLSGQDWTRSRESYLPRDIAGRVALLPQLVSAS